MKKLILTEIDGKKYSFYYEDDLLTEMDVLVPSKGNVAEIGQIFVGQVKKILPNIQAAFIEYAKGQNGFLPLSDLGERKDYLKCGDLLPVQIEKAAVKTKDPVLSTRLALSGHYTVVQLYDSRIGYSAKLMQERKEYLRAETEKDLKALQDGFKERFGECIGIVVRTSAEKEDVTPQMILDEAKALSEQLGDLYKHSKMRTLYSVLYGKASFGLQKYYHFRQLGVEEIVTDDKDVYEELSGAAKKDGFTELNIRFYEDPDYPLRALYSLQTGLEEVLFKKVWLKCGGFLVIEETEALSVIDVNSGKNISGKERESTFAKINREAAIESARQIRLRNLSGIILIDFINCKEESSFIEVLKQEFLKDPVKTYFVDITPLGLVEITRQKKTAPLSEKLMPNR
ncbi:MAG: ribonuclease E/G [Lachnospiraceae bacterium]|jgi:ribonuclease G|nr:ribonuclease E/G [Lachnospiraceae bacterium]